MSLIDQVRAARRVSVPIVAISTPDAASTISKIIAGINGECPKLQWDIVNGVLPRNDAGAAALSCGNVEDTVMNPVGALLFAKQLPEGSVLFLHNAQRFLEDTAFLQAVWNLRDLFKQDRRMLVLLGPDLRLPPELSGDVVVLDEPLPAQEEIEGIIREVHEAAGVTLAEEVVPKAVAATTGLPAFQVEQLTAMSLTPDGIVMDDLWTRKCKQIEQTPGLSVYGGRETFEDVGGVTNVKDFLYRFCLGPDAPGAIVWIDEIDKQMAGEGDLSGVSQDQLGAMLTYMENMRVDGLLFLGPPGCSKSLAAKAVGNEAGIKTVALDLGASKGSLVGQSEQRIRDALKVVTSISNGRPLFIATCNSIERLNTALLRRFPLTFYFDLPDGNERTKIWEIQMAAHSLGTQATPDDRMWSGADIRNCCKLARKTSTPLEIAAKWVVPVGVRSAAEIEKLRQQANGRFLSASYPGVYRQIQQEAPKGRKLDVA